MRWDPRNEIRALLEVTPERSLTLPACDTGRRRLSMNQGTGSHQTPNLPEPDPTSASRTVRSKRLLFEPRHPYFATAAWMG